MSDPFGSLKNFLQWLASEKSEFHAFVLIFFSGAWGGVIRYMTQVRAHTLKFTISSFFFELFVSTFAGMVPGFLIYGLTHSIWYTTAISAYAGHRGARQVFQLINKFIEKKIDP